MMDPFKCADLVTQAVIADTVIPCELVIFADSSTRCKAKKGNAKTCEHSVEIKLNGERAMDTHLMLTMMIGFSISMLLRTRAPPSKTQLEPEPLSPPLIMPSTG